MTKHRTNPKVDTWLSQATRWQEELGKLRKIMLDCGLTEELKWGKPCYTVEGGNVVIIYGLKESCAVGFLKGVLLKDPEGILIKPGENSQFGRWVKFTSVREITAKESVLKAYVREAIAAERAGLKVVLPKNPKLVYPEEFQKKLDASPALKTAFEALTPGRRRAYNLFFTAAKQSQTRESRVEQYRERILKGKGINDCVCGHSKKYPACDGSHKFFQPGK